MLYPSLSMVLSSITILPAVVLGNPLVKRSGETMYLSNCNRFEAAKLYSEMYYYSNGANSQNGQTPYSTCYASSGYVNWEGGEVICHFSSGVAFTSHIQSNGQSVALNTETGTENNDYRAFNCFRDNQKTLYTATRIACKSIYYCLDNTGKLQFWRIPSLIRFSRQSQPSMMTKKNLRKD
ncbi:MAG: hypothetical protein Q9203_004031 [Teloschistes exilis]